jgi:hypothetical protein
MSALSTLLDQIKPSIIRIVEEREEIHDSTLDIINSFDKNDPVLTNFHLLTTPVQFEYMNSLNKFNSCLLIWRNELTFKETTKSFSKLNNSIKHFLKHRESCKKRIFDKSSLENESMTNLIEIIKCQIKEIEDLKRMLKDEKRIINDVKTTVNNITTPLKEGNSKNGVDITMTPYKQIKETTQKFVYYRINKGKYHLDDGCYNATQKIFSDVPQNDICSLCLLRRHHQ